jgi:hypothetical protein
MPPTATPAPSPTPPAAGTPTARAAPPGASPPASGAACAAGVDLLGFSDALDKARFEDTAVGGLSALAYDPTRDVYLALVDNERDTPARLYTVRLPLAGGALGRPEVMGVTRLRDAAGRPFTGRTLDGEGLARLPAGDLLVASETEPSLRRFAPDGRLLAELAAPARFQVAPRGQATANMTFEGLAIGPDGTVVFVAMEGPLAPDGWTNDGRGRLRLLRYEERGEASFVAVAHYFYLTEPGQAVSELVVLDGGDLLVLERGFFPGAGNTVRLFRVTPSGAADVTQRASLDAPDLTPLRKQVLVDLAACPPGGARHPAAQPTPLLDNYEAMALGPALPDGRRTLLLVSDDNFGADQVTRVLALAVRP